MRILRFVLSFVVLSNCALFGGSLTVTRLQCEFATDPAGVDVSVPRLSWQIESDVRGQKQTAFQIVASSTKECLGKDRGDMWDSGRVPGEQSVLAPYGGTPLKSSEEVFWKVRVWDKDGKRSRWSKPARWIMGVIETNDWKAQWIGADTSMGGLPKIGYHSATSKEEDDVKWVQIDLGGVRHIEKIVVWPMDHQKRKGFGFPLRFQIDVSRTEDFREKTTIANHTAGDFASPGADPVEFAAPVEARYVRLTASKLYQREAGAWVLALSELEVFGGGRNLALGAAVQPKDTTENYGWGKAGLTDGRHEPQGSRPKSQTLVLRKEFKVGEGLRRAVLHVAGPGCYEFSLNGKKVGDALFPSGWTKYDKTCLYDTYDVTSLVKAGNNAAGILIGNGMYRVVGGRYYKFLGSFGPPKAIAQIWLEYRDGKVEVIGTGSDWKMNAGPITFSCVYGGEDYDARLEQAGWALPGFSDSGWQQAMIVPGPGGALRGLSCSSPPIRAFEVLRPVKVTDIKAGVRVYDLGQNASIMPRLKARGVAGASVRIIPAELIHDDGTVNRRSCGGGNAWWQYTLKGGGKQEEYFPKFYYHGSRYLQVECSSPEGSKLPRVEIEGVVVHGDCEPVGEFECSNELFNRIRRLIRWAQRSNMMTVLTDCPHREKLGWLEQYHLNGPSLRYEFNLAQLFTKGMNDMADCQLPDGLVPDIAPEYVRFSGGFLDSPEWGSACVLVPWQQYLFHGDVTLMRRYYPVMEAYVAYLGSRATNHIVSHGLGDWYDIGPKPPGYAQLTPIPLTATAFYYYDCWVLAQAAALLGNPAKAEQYSKLAAAIREAFNNEFFDEEKGFYGWNSQAGNAIALEMGLAPEEARARILKAIVEDVTSRGNAITAGDVGYRYLLRALAGQGRSDVIYAMNNQSEKPGYGYQLQRGATSLTEAWDARPESSHNHFMLGQIMEWFYHDLAGIQPCTEGAGFKKTVFQPSFPEGLTWARASYGSDFGKISSYWERRGNRILLRVTVPPNATGELRIPCKTPGQVSESGKPVRGGRGVELLRHENGKATYSLSSGRFEFSFEP